MDRIDSPRTRLLPATSEGVAEAARLLRGGGLVAFPTETVYGLGARAADGHAVARIFEAKGRPSFNPLIVHVADPGEAEALAETGPEARALMEAFWPGPLALVLPLRAGAPVADLVTAGLPTVALRAPAHPLAQALIAAAGPLAAPSANPSGRVSPTAPSHVLAGLGGRIEAVLDGGPCPVGVESTIVAPDGADGMRLLRAGGLPAETIEAVLGRPLIADTDPARIVAPGQMESHYAPRGRLRLGAMAAEPGEILLGFGAVAGDLSLSPSGDLREAAANLFAALHRLDAEGAERIAVAPVPDHGLGRAINDRLRRAAAPRP
ncbi:translation factor SUA5 [Rubellimicrobium thermophilum DSM 16684]|uniref:Threonylcarbamoyl-AMP synthase n=1 Tax=Rubellimicrobium thermophilum DSM 16684 TaxID=1123069 RepID=S9QU59_9RHOB|nr:L-threonylcarbamoyladenylate synthase [Rubellimicrobium thermophilum]EPX83173.1 translation factor SUA5 [Rubellimicrobium thermophilum DSM 16684]